MQGQDGTPFLSYYDVEHALSFVWDGTQDENDERWIDVSFGGSGEPVVLRIPWVIRITASTGNVTTDTLIAFGDTCGSFINLLHQMEDVTVGHIARCSSDDPNNHQGATCPIHEDAALIEARVR
jgi:chloramphenicol 3-O-phosphotransferase